MHRSAPSPTTPRLLAEQLRHEPARGDATCDGVTVLAIGPRDRVGGPQRLHHADSDRLLAVVQVQEAADLAGAVQLGTAILEAADAQHLAQQVQAVLARHRMLLDRLWVHAPDSS